MRADATNSPTERILTIPGSSVEHLYHMQAFYDNRECVGSVMRCIQDCGEFVDRRIAEKDPSRIQVVACAFVRNGENLLCLRRSRKTQRDALRLRYTLLLGGHVSQEDGLEPGSAARCVVRELGEELGLTVEGFPPIAGLIADPSTDVGLHHLAVVFDVHVTWNELQYDCSHDRDEFTYSKSSGVYSLMTPDDISRITERMDPWSSIFLSSDVADQILGRSMPRSAARQLYFLFDTEEDYHGTRRTSLRS